MMKKLTALLLALLLAALPMLALAEEELAEGDTDEALVEEDGASAYTVPVGSYEWYMLPGDIEDGHAYVDIYPTQETVTMKDGAWSYSFTMEEVNGVSFYPYTVVLIGFCEDTELTRNSFTADTFTSWWTGQIPAGSVVTYGGTEHNDALTALAISVIGSDETGYEQEFHSLVFLSK